MIFFRFKRVPTQSGDIRSYQFHARVPLILVVVALIIWMLTR
jgi:hypothetical protein